MEINGIAHVQLSVADFGKSRAFYGALLPALGMKVQYDEPGAYYCIGGRTGVLITPCDEAMTGERFQRRPGLQGITAALTASRPLAQRLGVRARRLAS